MNASIETPNRGIKHLPPVARKRAERALGIAQPENEHRVFVYGTLLTGEGNAHWARSARRTPAWATGTIHDTGYGYPAFVRNGETRIQGELLTVDDEGFKSMDRLEGYPKALPPRGDRRVHFAGTRPRMGVHHEPPPRRREGHRGRRLAQVPPQGRESVTACRLISAAGYGII